MSGRRVTSPVKGRAGKNVEVPLACGRLLYFEIQTQKLTVVEIDIII